MAKKALIYLLANNGRAVDDIERIGEASEIDAWNHHLVSNGVLGKVTVPDGYDDSWMKGSSGAIVVDPAKALTWLDEKRTELRNTRDNLLDLTDKTQLGDFIITAGEKTNFETYRTELKDLTTKSSKLLDIDTVHASDDIKVEAKDAGGQDISIEVLDPSANDATLSCSIDGLKIIVSLATDGTGAITSTVQEVIDIINNHTDATLLVLVTLETGATGTNVVDTVIAVTSLTGGIDLDSPVYPTAPTAPILKGVND